MTREFFEDCQVGEAVTTPGRTITETDIVLFAAFTGDWFPVHVDAEFAKQTPFGERIAHGMLVLIVGSGLLLRLAEHALLPKATIALYGVEKVRFASPTRIGDTIHTEGEIVKLAELDKTRGFVSIRGEVKNHRGQLAVSFTLRALVGRRPPESAP